MAEQPVSQLYPATTIGKLFHLTDRRIRQLAKENIIPKATGGKYELVGCIQGYIEYLQEQAFGKSKKTGDHAAERIRVTKLTADKLELEVKHLSGELIAAEVVEKHLQTVFSTLRARLLVLPGRAATAAVAATDLHEIQESITVLVHEALNELADGFTNTDNTSNDGSSKTAKTTAETDSQPVGRSKKKTKQRSKRRARTVEH